MRLKITKYNPILKPDPKSVWQSLMVYNPGIIRHNGVYHLFYRAVGAGWISKIGHAVSDDGKKFICDKKPLLSPEMAIEKNGLEDPRIVGVDGLYYLTYTAYDGSSARLCLATSKDLKNWIRHGEMIPDWDFKRAHGFIVPWDSAQKTPAAVKHWSKAGGIFPEKINGKFYMLFGDRHIWLANSDNGLSWRPIYKPFLKPRLNFFDSAHIEMGPPPLKTKKGWLVLYHGIENKGGRITYSLGFVLLDLKNPSKILHRTSKPVFAPPAGFITSGFINILPGGFKAMEIMEQKNLKKFIKNTARNGELPRIIFCNGAVIVDDILKIYCGIGDTIIGTAAIKLKTLLDIHK
ncbi:MAG: hypothetical protein V1867_03170 [Candidatus Falkowbacteria bacterium]